MAERRLANLLHYPPLISRGWSPVVKLVVIYAILGAAWILLSDKFVLHLVRDPDVVSQLQTYKGWFYVAVTAVLLGFLMHYYLGELRRSENRLYESQRRLAGIIGSAMDGIVTVDEQSRIILFNPSAEKMFGHSAADILGQSLDILIPPRFRSAHAGHMILFSKTNTTSRNMGELGVVYGLRANGEEFPIEASISRVEIGGRTLLTVIHRDVAQRLQSEAALHESEERLRLALKAANQGLYDLNVQSGEAKVSAEYATMLGYDPETFRETNAKWIERLHPDDRERVAETYRAYIRGETPVYEVAFRQRTSSGNWVWILSLGKIVAWDGEGRPLRMLGTHTDINERKNAEEALRMSQSRLHSALEAGGMGTWTWDVPRDVFSWDDDAVKICGRARQEMADAAIENFMSFVHPDDRQHAWDALKNFLVGDGNKFAQEFRILTGDGTVRWIACIGRLHRDNDGKAGRMVGVCLDITDRKREEDSTIRSQKLEALGTLSGGIAHDFNNILLAIMGNANLAIEDLPAGHPVLESLTEIEKSADRASDLVRQILYFSRPQDLQRKVLPLRPIVEDALKLVRATLPAMIEIRTQFAEDLPKVACDTTQIHQIIVNLATNAAHAIGSKRGLIEFHLDSLSVNADLIKTTPELQVGRYVRLSVIDNGCGMDRQILSRIFDPFFTTKPTGQGTGLGLSVVHGIMKSINGAITVYSQVGDGSTFRLYFPVADTNPVQQPARATAAAKGKGERILYIDDEEALVALAKRMLKRLGYEVTAFTDVAAALAEFGKRPDDFDAIITDLAMPGMTGFELARELQAIRPDTPILMTSGYIGSEAQENVREIGAYALISKPHTVEELGRILEQLFRDRPPSTKKR
jgi:PAS domain S-box-containing protein